MGWVQSFNFAQYDLDIINSDQRIFLDREANFKFNKLPSWWCHSQEADIKVLICWWWKTTVLGVSWAKRAGRGAGAGAGAWWSTGQLPRAVTGSSTQKQRSFWRPASPCSSSSSSHGNNAMDGHFVHGFSWSTWELLLFPSCLHLAIAKQMQSNEALQMSERKCSSQVAHRC